MTQVLRVRGGARPADWQPRPASDNDASGSNLSSSQRNCETRSPCVHMRETQAGARVPFLSTSPNADRLDAPHQVLRMGRVAPEGSGMAQGIVASGSVSEFFLEVV